MENLIRERVSINMEVMDWNAYFYSYS